MADSLRILRGNKSDMPANLGAGVLAVCLDTKELYVGDGVSNLKIGMFDEVLPKSGGTASIITRTKDDVLILDSVNDGAYTWLTFRKNGAQIGDVGYSANGTPVVAVGGNAKELLHTGNKPSGSYTGNGSATERTISTGGIGFMCVIVSPTGGIAFATSNGLYEITGSSVTSSADATFNNGVLTINSTKATINASGDNYTYQVL